jgi:hypothetical protein
LSFDEETEPKVAFRRQIFPILTNERSDFALFAGRTRARAVGRTVAALILRFSRSFRFFRGAFVGVDPKRYWAVVDGRNGHVGAEDAGFGRDAERAEFGDEEFVKAVRRFRRGRVDETGAVPFDTIAEEGELADDERGAADLREVEVHSTFGVLEDAERRDFFR